nr:phosphoenolpyruvate carboxylase [Cupriavidus sp. amp6]
MRAQFGPRAVRNYIVSHTEEVSDLVEVLLLQKETGLLEGALGVKYGATAPGPEWPSGSFHLGRVPVTRSGLRAQAPIADARSMNKLQRLPQASVRFGNQDRSCGRDNAPHGSPQQRAKLLQQMNVGGSRCKGIAQDNRVWQFLTGERFAGTSLCKQPHCIGPF